MAPWILVTVVTTGVILGFGLALFGLYLQARRAIFSINNYCNTHAVLDYNNVSNIIIGDSKKRRNELVNDIADHPAVVLEVSAILALYSLESDEPTG